MAWRRRRELLSGGQLIGVTVLLHCQIKMPFRASKTPAAAVSPVIKMLLFLPNPSDFNYKYFISSLTAWTGFFSLPGKALGVGGINAAVGYDKIIYLFFVFFSVIPVNYSYPHIIINSTFSSSICKMGGNINK